jgi:putative DNA primase/helicase
VLVLVDGGEKLYLDSDLEACSQAEQASAMEQDDREGLVSAYLNLPLPENWDSMDVYARQEYVSDPDSPTQPKGTVVSVTASAIWKSGVNASVNAKRTSSPPTPTQ